MARCRSLRCRSLTATTEASTSAWNAASRQCRGCRPSPSHHTAGSCSRDLCGRSPPSRGRSTSTRPSTRLVSKASFSLPHRRDRLDERVDDEQSGRGSFKALRASQTCSRGAHHPLHPGPDVHCVLTDGGVGPPKHPQACIQLADTTASRSRSRAALVAIWKPSPPPGTLADTPRSYPRPHC